MMSTPGAPEASSHALQLSISVAAVLFGVVAMVVIVRINRELGGRVRQALRFVVLGILCNVLAILWSLFWGHGQIVGNTYVDIHQNLMTVGMICFIISTIRFSKLMQNV